MQEKEDLSGDISSLKVELENIKQLSEEQEEIIYKKSVQI